jgi:hypothetical protein
VQRGVVMESASIYFVILLLLGLLGSSLVWQVSEGLDLSYRSLFTKIWLALSLLHVVFG